MVWNLPIQRNWFWHQLWFSWFEARKNWVTNSCTHSTSCHLPENYLASFAAAKSVHRVRTKCGGKDTERKKNTLKLQFCEFQMQQNCILCQIHCQNLEGICITSLTDQLSGCPSLLKHRTWRTEQEVAQQLMCKPWNSFSVKILERNDLAY